MILNSEATMFDFVLHKNCSLAVKHDDMIIGLLISTYEYQYEADSVLLDWIEAKTCLRYDGRVYELGEWMSIFATMEEA